MSDPSGYALGYTDLEHDRLLRQAERLRTRTESFFREAGVGEGLRVLDLGSGIGDVAMLVARIVGPAGRVVGVERDERSVDRARTRAAAAGFTNITFLASDVTEVTDAEPFDAVVGRFILQFLPDPAGALRSVSSLLRPGGLVAFQEVSWAPSRAANGHLRLWSTCASIAQESMRRAGANTDIGLTLYRIFYEAGIPEPHIKVDMQMGSARENILWPHDLLRSVRPAVPGDGTFAALGDLETLADRLEAEALHTRSIVASVTVIGAWSRLR